MSAQPTSLLARLLAYLDHAPVTTVLTVVAFILIGIVGGVVTIVQPETLPFDDYVKVLAGFSVGNGLVGIGRGVLKGSAVASGAIPPPPPGA